MRRRYLALWFPFLPTDRARRERGEASPAHGEPPFVLVEKAGGALVLAAIDAGAARQGLRIGMTLAQARALLPHLRTAPADRLADAALLARAAAACERFTPLVALAGEDGLLLDITGCARLFGGEEALRAKARALAGLGGLSSRAAIAGTPDAAWALARFCDGTIAPPGRDAEATRALPVTALDRDSATILALTRAGLKRLGDLADRPSQGLAARFGTETTTRLARILGREDRRITPLRAPPDIMAERHFPEPLAAMESLLAVLERLAGDITRRLEERGAGGRVFEARFFRADGAVRALSVRTARPMREAAGLTRLLRLRLDALADPLDPGFGFDAIRLAVLRAEPLDMAQRDLEGGAPPAEAVDVLASLADRLAARLGRAHVQRLVMCDTHDPAGAGAFLPWQDVSTAGAAPAPELEPGDPPLRPLTLFEPPQGIEAVAEVPDGPPRRFRWRRVLHEVARAEGPERIAPQWWRAGDAPPPVRDYYRIEDAEGCRFWLFREGGYGAPLRPRWFLHGLFA